MKRALLFGLALVSLIFFSACESNAHGVGYKNSDAKSVTLEFFYSTGEKMSYCETKVFSPNDDKFAAQTGRTDEQGRFAVIADVPGEWRVIVKDNEGHQCEAKLAVSEKYLADRENTLSANNNGTLPQGMDLAVRAVLGVSIIFNIAMIIRRRNANAH